MANYKYNEMKNSSGCPDPTAHEAINRADEGYIRLSKLLRTIFSICEIAGFCIEGRITFIDEKTGKIYR